MQVCVCACVQLPVGGAQKLVLFVETAKQKLAQCKEPQLPCPCPCTGSKCYHSLVQLHMDNAGHHDAVRLEKAWKVIKEALKAVRGAPPVSLHRVVVCCAVM